MSCFVYLCIAAELSPVFPEEEEEAAEEPHHPPNMDLLFALGFSSAVAVLEDTPPAAEEPPNTEPSKAEDDPSPVGDGLMKLFLLERRPLLSAAMLRLSPNLKVSARVLTGSFALGAVEEED